MRTPLLVVTGVDATAMDAAVLALSLDLPGVVVVRHRIDPVTQVLTRTVSDASGHLETAHVELEHACVDCALREDVLPTIEHLARAGRWDAVVSCLPVASEADQVSAVLEHDTRLARHVRLASVVAALGGEVDAGGEDVVEDLLCDDDLADRGLQTGPDDDRGLGEVACAQVELADVTVLTGGSGPQLAALVGALARPEAMLVTGCAELDAGALLAGRHDHEAAVAWMLPTDDEPLAEPSAEQTGEARAWRRVLVSHRPFHPERLVDDIESLGCGRWRARGCFWVATRPGDLGEWSGAGGQLSIGTWQRWGARTPLTRLVYTGVGEPPAGLEEAFERMLVTPEEGLLGTGSWRVAEDGLEPWLGEITDVA
ncbi:CobW family GTP-binding protein [Nocardioides bruguierae]|uniref:CobW family GTP-binding protein n=1 Tax=Nocardioides bruguierae TaxID=2945102 RepID=UPI00201FFBBA|nr:GTP-binding protein [Nocardioides bruguierae]MCL8024514.1 GTP-binding protein [Nocardioides bruguierae]